MTVCEDCDHCRKEGAWYRWQCGKFPRLEGMGYVTKDKRETDPLMYCKDINGGACPLFTPKRTNQINLNIEEK